MKPLMDLMKAREIARQLNRAVDLAKKKDAESQGKARKIYESAIKAYWNLAPAERVYCDSLCEKHQGLTLNA